MTIMQDQMLCRSDIISDFLEQFTEMDVDDPRFIKAVNQIMQVICDLEVEIAPN